MNGGEPQLAEGRVDRELAEEFPGLALYSCTVEADCGRSPRYIREQLAHLSNKVVGDRAINLRREPIAHAYRVFFRQIGLDPDQARTPIEAVMVERLRAGRFASAGMPADALTITIIESGVALCALDAQAVEGQLGLRLSAPRERLAASKSEPQLPGGTIVLADAEKPLAPIFGAAAASATPARGTQRVALCAIGVEGVPRIIVEEALWKCARALTEASEGR